MYITTKTYGHDLGLSCCFRQWRAESHCQQLHGYAIAVRIEFASYTLDAQNWVIDFGGLKDLKAWLTAMFDHTLLVAEDDPQLDVLLGLSAPEVGLARVHVLPAVGCEAFAQLIHARATLWLADEAHGALNKRVVVHRVTVREHGANEASYDVKGMRHG